MSDSKLVLCRIQENGLIRREDNGGLVGKLFDDISYIDLIDEYPEEDDDDLVNGRWICSECGKDWGDGKNFRFTDRVMAYVCPTIGDRGGCGYIAVKWIEPTPKEKAEPSRPKNYDSIMHEDLDREFETRDEPYGWEDEGLYGMGYDAGMRWGAMQAEAKK